MTPPKKGHDAVPKSRPLTVPANRAAPPVHLPDQVHAPCLEYHYLAWHKRRLTEALTRFNHCYPEQPMGLFGNLFSFHWLRREIHPDYRAKVLALAGSDPNQRPITLLLAASDPHDYVRRLLDYWCQGLPPDHPRRQEARDWLDRENTSPALAADRVIRQWHRLNLPSQPEPVWVRQIRQQQKEIDREMGGGEDRQRAALVDALPDRPTGGVTFEKIGMIPHMACPTNCRHCLFVWRRPMKNLPDPGPLLRQIDGLTANLLFTGGDLSQHLAEFYRAIEEVASVRVFAILLNGAVAATPADADHLFQALRTALKRRPTRFPPAQVVLQISFDEYHQEIVCNKAGMLRERVPVAAIAHLVARAPHYPETRLILLHKQNRLNFSQALFHEGVFLRLSQTLAALGHTVENLHWQTSPRPKADPARPTHKGGVIRDVVFNLKGYPDHPIHLMSSTLDGYGRAALLDRSEAVDERAYLQQILTQGPPSGERFDTDPMLWYDGSVTLFNAAHFWLGNLLEEGPRLFARHRKDPLLAALARFDPQLLTFYAEQAADLDRLQAETTGPHHLYHQLVRTASLRLHLTKRLLDAR